MAPRAAAVTLGQMEEKTVLQTCLMCRLCWESRDSKMSTITSTHSGSASSCSAAAHNQEKQRKHLHLKKNTFFSPPAKFPDFLGNLSASSSSWISSPELCPCSSAGPSRHPAALQEPSGAKKQTRYRDSFFYFSMSLILLAASSTLTLKRCMPTNRKSCWNAVFSAVAPFLDFFFRFATESIILGKN